jgi:hypothetical protein
VRCQQHIAGADRRHDSEPAAIAAIFHGRPDRVSVDNMLACETTTTGDARADMAATVCVSVSASASGVWLRIASST